MCAQRVRARTFIHLKKKGNKIMKQTEITNINKNSEQLMTSIEIAELTGKNHKDVLKAIRNMEPAWEKEAGRKFALGSYEDINGQSRPCYFLSKSETLFVSTKLHDEARARLVLRWEELERERLMEEQKPKQKIKEIRLLTCDEEILDEADAIIGDELEELNRKSKYCYTATEIGKIFNMDGKDLNSFLCDQKIIHWSCGQWRLTKKYLHLDLTADRYKYVHAKDGRRKLESYLVWTEKGREFITDFVYKKNVKM